MIKQYLVLLYTLLITNTDEFFTQFNKQILHLHIVDNNFVTINFLLRFFTIDEQFFDFSITHKFEHFKDKSFINLITSIVGRVKNSSNSNNIISY